MSQNNLSDKAAMLAIIGNINKVDGFDPAPFAIDYADLNTGEVRKRLPVMIQMAWFRLKYPEGRIAVQVVPARDCFVATARIYPSYKDPADAYLAEATASRGYCEDKPSVSPREWAQTAAVVIALRNAGFGLQFSMAGEDFESVAPDELGTFAGNPGDGSAIPVQMPADGNFMSAQAPGDGSAIPVRMPAGGSAISTQIPVAQTVPEDEYTVEEPKQRELTPEEKMKQAMQVMCPISKYKGRTLGEVVVLDPKAVVWVATKFMGNEEVREAAKLICDLSLQQASA